MASGVSALSLSAASAAAIRSRMSACGSAASTASSAGSALSKICAAVDRAQQLQEAVVEQQDARGQCELGLGAGGEAGEHRQRQLGLDAFLAREIGGEAGGLRVAGDGGAVAGQQLRLALQAAGQAGARRRQRRDRLAAGLAPAEPDVAPGAQRLHDGAGRPVLAQHRLHVGEQPGAVERLQAQRHEVLGVGRACRRRGRRQQHAPPQLMQRRRARRQLEARQQLLERLEVEPAPQLERQPRGVGRHDGRELAPLDRAAARRGPRRRLLADRLAARARASARAARRGRLAGARAAFAGALGVRLEGVPALLGGAGGAGQTGDGETQQGPPDRDGVSGGAHGCSTAGRSKGVARASPETSDGP